MTTGAAAAHAAIQKPQPKLRGGAIRRLHALMGKEFLQVVRDPSSILVAFVLPLILLFLFGYGMSLDPTETRIGLIVERTDPTSRSLADAFSRSRYFDTVVGRDRRELGDALAAGDIRGLVVIPADFSERFAAGADSSVQVIVDGSEPNTARFVQNYARGVVATWRSQLAALTAVESEPPVTTAPRYWYNPELDSRNFLVPGSTAIIMTLIGTLLTALVMAREWERGTMEAMMATPIGVLELIIGKLVPYFVLGLAAMSVCTAVAVFLFGVPFRGSIPGLLMISSAFLVPALGQGLLISAVSKNQFVASQMALMSGFLPATLLSGFIFEISTMPAPIQWLTTVIPARYFISSLQTVFLAGDVWPLMLRDTTAMLAIGAVFVGLSAKATRKRLD